jgi:hypothetical protein
MLPFQAFPSDKDDPKVKSKKAWLLQYCKAALSSYADLPTGSIGFRSRDNYEKNKMYALGRQPVAKYKTIFNHGDDPKNTLLVTDWSIRPEIKKLRRIIVSLVEQLPYNVQINPIDDLAKDEMEMEMLRQEAKLLARQAIAQQGEQEMLNLRSLKVYPDEAKDFQELQIKELGLRHATSMDIELVTELVFNANNYDDLVGELVQDAIDCGICIVKDETIDDKTIGISRVDPRDLLISYCRRSDFSDWKYMGEIKRMPVSKLLSVTNGQVSREDIDAIYNIGMNAMVQWGLGMDFGDWGTSSETFYNRGIVYVVEIEIRSTDTIVLEERDIKNGTKIYALGNPTKKGKNPSKEKIIENIYCAKWVVGTDILYDFGKKRNMKREQTNEACVKSSYHIQACDFYDMVATSRIEELIPYTDAIQLATYRLQHALNTVVPKGYQINFDALEAVDLGAGGAEGKMTPKDILDLFFERGILLTRQQSVDGRNIQRAIETLEGGVGSEIQEFWTLITQNKTMMRESLGLNELTDGSTPNARTLTEVAKAATSGTNNALSDLFKMQRRLIKELTESIIIRAQDIVKFGNDKYFVSALGSGSIKLIKNIKDIHKYIYSVSIQDNPSQDDVASFQNQLVVAQQSGEITISDVLMLDNIDNLKMKQAYLNYAVSKNKESKQKESLQMQEMNGKIQQESAMIAEQAKQQTIQMQIELQLQADLQRIMAEKEKDVTIEQIRLEGKRIDATGRVESAQAQAEGRDIANKRDNIVKLELAETPKDKEIVENIVADNKTSTIEPQTAFGNEIKLQKFNFLPPEEEMGEETEVETEGEMPMPMPNQGGMKMQGEEKEEEGEEEEGEEEGENEEEEYANEEENMNEEEGNMNEEDMGNQLGMQGMPM